MRLKVIVMKLLIFSVTQQSLDAERVLINLVRQFIVYCSRGLQFSVGVGENQNIL